MTIRPIDDVSGLSDDRDEPESEQARRERCLHELYPELAAGSPIPDGPLGLIKLRFAEPVAIWGICLPDEDVVNRRAGSIDHAGWTIDYRFGADERGEYLDSYAHHRMTDDTEVRIRADGTLEGLPEPFDRAISEAAPAPPDPAAEPLAELVSRASQLLADVAADTPFPDFVQHTPLDEAWFSDRLAWLLDTRGSHGLGTRFAGEFLKTLARIRTEGHPHEDHRYGHRAKFLRWSTRAEPGTVATRFSLRNSAVFREFYLTSRLAGPCAGSGIYCDLVFLDLDPTDSLFVAIENKLFSTDRDSQLTYYHGIIEGRYHRAKVVEYVYLTLLGAAPIYLASASSDCRGAWLRVSWVHDILPILDRFAAEADLQAGVGELRAILAWLRRISEGGAASRALAVDLAAQLAGCAADLLVDELARLTSS